VEREHLFDGVRIVILLTEMNLETRIQLEFEQAFKRARQRPVYEFSSRLSLSESLRAAESAAPEAYTIQNVIRPAFGKPGLNQAIIGEHPDFVSLRGTSDFAESAITTMFMDMQNATKLSLVNRLEDAFYIKNAFIRTAIEIVSAFDGHVHQIMGDAVMAYFGRINETPEVGIINGINCAASLAAFSSQVVAPLLDKEGFGDTFGIRIGLDHEKKVLWGCYGFPGMNAVVATGFGVDAAAKLQHHAPKNQVMIGQSIRNAIDFPETLLRWKEEEVDTSKRIVKYMTPNFTINERPMNYEMQVLKWKDYLGLTPLSDSPHLQVLSLNSNSAYYLKIEEYRTRQGSCLGPYVPCSRNLEKDRELLFTLSIPPIDRQCTVTFRVENHGVEAAADELALTHVQTFNIGASPAIQTCSAWESTKYRGLHYMTVTVNQDTRAVWTKSVGVYIE
jgi:adenylate cyclase